MLRYFVGYFVAYVDCVFSSWPSGDYSCDVEGVRIKHVSKRLLVSLDQRGCEVVST